MNQNELIRQLRETARRKDMLKCEQTMRELLKTLDMRDVLQIALKEVRTYLPVFEELHPQKIWVREWLELASKFQPIDYSSHEFGMFTDFNEDSASKAYIKAIQLLDGALRAYFQQISDVPVNLTADAISNVASAKMFAYLSKNAPSIWMNYEKMFGKPDMFSEAEKSRIAKEFRQNSERGKFIESFWTELSDEIAHKLSVDKTD